MVAICVIGSGAAGLAALKVISETPQVRAGLWSIVAFEARDNVGGVW
jgi:cation diffusion facilitator CzcD-associated flavoprotein CzcO